MVMDPLDAGSRQFTYLEDARSFALARKGNERIVKTGEQFEVQALPDLEQQNDLMPNLIDFRSQGIQEQLKTQVSSRAGEAPIVEFLIDTQLDGDFLPDRRFNVENGDVKESQYRVRGVSEALRSPELKGLEVLREAIQNNNTAPLLRLSPRTTDALLASNQLTPAERDYARQKLDAEPVRVARAQFAKFFGPDDAFSGAGVRDFDTLVSRLNEPTHRQNLATLHEIARYPERFQTQYEGRDQDLASLAETLQQLPGFRRYPSSQATGVPPATLGPRQKVYDNALRTLKQYDYKLQVSQGMQFNQNGIAGHDTQIDYRYGGRIFSLGLSGQDYNFSGEFNKGFGFADQTDASKRLRLGYNSGDFDLRVGLAQDRQGKLVVERPESEAAERYIARKGDEAKAWAKDNPLITGSIIAAAAGGAYAYSLANPDQNLSVDFNQRFNLIDTEFLRMRAEISPELHLKNGELDLGVRRVGLGASGNFRDHSYDASLRHQLENTTIRSGDIQNDNTELNLRYGYRSHSVTLDNRYSYAAGQLSTQVGYQRNFVHSASLDTYVRPYAQLNNGTYANAGVSAGVSKDFGGGFQGQLNVDYNQAGGASGGFRLIKQFDW